MLLLTRKPGQAITIQPKEGMNLDAPVSTLFTNGPIEFRVNKISRSGVSIGIAAHHQLCILRDELSFQSDFYPAGLPEHNGCREILARNVLTLRLQRKRSIQELADESNLTFNTICALERGDGLLELGDLDDLAKALNVNVGILLSEEE